MTFSVHATAIVDEGASIGDQTRIWHWVHVCSGARIGRDCSLGQNVFVGNRVTIGNSVKVQNNVSIYDEVHLEDHVFCGPSMVFTNVVNPRSHVGRRLEYQKTIVRTGATIGANATIVCGHTIGKYAFIGAGAVVTKEVPDYALLVGNPAVRVGWMCQCGVRLPNEGKVSCNACGQPYAISDEACRPL